MKLDAAELAQRLRSELGADAVSIEPALLAAHSIDGIKPALLCAPETPEQCSTVLRLCAEADAAVTPWGGGTAMAIGNLPRRVEVILGSHRLTRVIDLDSANLTATVQSGLALASLQAILARENQYAPFDPPQPARSTVGGIVAANLNGVRRASQGSVRDLIIGMKVALHSGEQVKAGGKVVKNVAGYDMCKLFTGSLGTLGFITEVTLRLLPLPQRAATVTAAGTVAQLFQLANGLAGSPLLPSGVAILNAGAAEFAGATPKEALAAIRFEGFDTSVARQVADACGMAGQSGLVGETLSDDGAARFWQAVDDLSLAPDRLIYRLTVPLGKLPEVTAKTGELFSGDSRSCLAADAAFGTLWVSLEPTEENGKQFTNLLSAARAAGGHAVMLSAPPALKRGVDVWGEPPRALALMRGIKRQFDPGGLLNPGRFAGGI